MGIQNQANAQTSGGGDPAPQPDVAPRESPQAANLPPIDETPEGLVARISAHVAGERARPPAFFLHHGAVAFNATRTAERIEIPPEKFARLLDQAEREFPNGGTHIALRVQQLIEGHLAHSDRIKLIAYSLFPDDRGLQAALGTFLHLDYPHPKLSGEQAERLRAALVGRVGERLVKEIESWTTAAAEAVASAQHIPRSRLDRSRPAILGGPTRAARNVIMGGFVSQVADALAREDKIPQV